MTSTSLAIGWVQLLALLAAEVGLVALGVALVRRWCPSAAWHRTFCQAGIAAVLVITACELSGSARMLGRWATNTDKPSPSRQFACQRAGFPDRRQRRRSCRRGRLLTSPRRRPAALYPWGRPPGLPVARRPRLVLHLLPCRARPLFPPTTHLTPVSDSMAVLWLCIIWAAGAALAGARVCLAQCLFLIFQLRRRPVAEPALVERVQALARSLGIRRRVRVMESKRLTSPIAFGLIRPAVGLPPNFTERFDAARQNAVLAHELAHLAAHDPFWCLLADVAAVLLWWHPGVWWLRRQLHLASEMAADEASLLVADGPRILAECLVELGARLSRPLALGQLRVSGFRSHLGRRVQRLVHLEGRAWSPLPRLGAALVRIFGPMAMTAIVVLCTAWAAPQALTKGNSMKTMQLNWKRSLATLALLAAFNGPEATVAVAQPDKPPAPPAPPPEVTPAAPAASGASQRRRAGNRSPIRPQTASGSRSRGCLPQAVWSGKPAARAPAPEVRSKQTASVRGLPQALRLGPGQCFGHAS